MKNNIKYALLLLATCGIATVFFTGCGTETTPANANQSTVTFYGAGQ